MNPEPQRLLADPDAVPPPLESVDRETGHERRRDRRADVDAERLHAEAAAIVRFGAMEQARPR